MPNASPFRHLAVGAVIALTLATTSCSQQARVEPPPSAPPTTPAQQLDVCEKNLKLMATALDLYANASQGAYPAALTAVAPLYLKSLPTCPSAQADTYTAGYTTNDRGFALACKGSHHTATGKAADQPSIASAPAASPAPGASPAAGATPAPH
ncbi:MAG: hypothetical protein EB084_14315 [Proteobacteria bacterium]|nr:hypothetical protein [Pseudomonadota bacterium]